MEEVWAWLKIKNGHYKFAKVEKESVKQYNFICKKCKTKNNYWAEKNCFPYKCLSCKDTGEKSKIGLVYEKQIPTWRLHLDDASFQDIITKNSQEFGMPYMSEEKWQAFYSQEREVKKKMEAQKMKKTLLREAMRELSKEMEKGYD